MMQHSEALNEFAAALSKAQGEMENAAKNAANPHFKSRYADLAEILNTVRPALAKHGLSVVQGQAHGDGCVTVETLLMHQSGQWVRTSCTAAVAKTDPQAIGSAVTYLRRYSLAAVCGIAQEDDDAESAHGRGNQPARAQQRRASGERREQRQQGGTPATATEAQLGAISEMMQSHTITEKERKGLQKRMNDGMDRKQASEAIEWLKTTIADREDAEEQAAAN